MGVQKRVMQIIGGIWWSRSISLIGSTLPPHEKCRAYGLAFHIPNSPRQVTSKWWGASGGRDDMLWCRWWCSGVQLLIVTMAMVDQGSGGEIAWRAALDSGVRPHVGVIPKVYNHCEPAAQVVRAHTHVRARVCVYLCVCVSVQVCCNLPGKLIWPKLPTGSEILKSYRPAFS